MTATAETDRLHVWRDLIREHFVALDIRADARARFSGTVRAGAVGHLRVASVRSGTQTFRRTPGLARRDELAYLQVGMITAGSGTVVQDGREATLRSGDFAVYDTGRPFLWDMAGDWELLVLTWPRATTGLGDPDSRQLTARALGRDGLGAMVGRMLREVVTAPPELSAAGGVRLAHEIAELVTTVAGEGLGTPEPSRAADDLLRRVDAYVVEHLADPGLGPASIAAAHFVSTRHLHRLFARRGATVAQQVQRMRLERCRRDLRDPRCDHRSITDIALRRGFPDLAAFSRAFRAAYGSSPSEWRAAQNGTWT
jgi:AraC-like DNA-binding protein